MWKLYLTLVVALLLIACVPPGPGVEIGPPPQSPLIPNQVPVLLENQWRLTEIIHNGARRNFTSIDPVLITFQPGVLSIQACNSIAYFLDTTGIEDANEYRLSAAGGTARQCEFGGTAEERVFGLALRATNRYEIIGDTLILSGEHAQHTFVMDNEAEKPPDW